MGLQERYQMDPRVRPLFPGMRFAGIAHTDEYDRTDEPLEAMNYEEFAARQYRQGPEDLCTRLARGEPPDEVLIIDAKGT